MSVCKDIKGYSRQHERLADFFSLLAVALFFGTLFATVIYHQFIISWLQQDILLHSALALCVLILDVFLIFLFLNFGSARFAEEDDGCFRTFRGRRAGTGSVGMMFNSWLQHMEHVGKKHR